MYTSMIPSVAFTPSPAARIAAPSTVQRVQRMRAQIDLMQSQLDEKSTNSKGCSTISLVSYAPDSVAGPPAECACAAEHTHTHARTRTHWKVRAYSCACVRARARTCVCGGIACMCTCVHACVRTGSTLPEGVSVATPYTPLALRRRRVRSAEWS